MCQAGAGTGPPAAQGPGHLQGRTRTHGACVSRARGRLSSRMLMWLAPHVRQLPACPPPAGPRFTGTPGPRRCHLSHCLDEPVEAPRREGTCGGTALLRSRAGSRGPEVTELGVVPRPDADPTAVGPGMGVQGLPGSSSRASWNTPGGSPAAEGTESLTAEADGDVSAGVTQGSGLEADPAAGTAASPTHGLTSAARTQAPPWASSAQEKALSTLVAPRRAPGPGSPGPREALEESGV